MGTKLFTTFVREIASELNTEGRYGTAHIYQSTANSLAKFLRNQPLGLYGVTPAVLKRYEEWLRQRGLAWDTVGTYMHTLQAAYNRAVDRHKAPFVPRLFKHVFTGRALERKGALEVEQVRSLLKEDTTTTLPSLLEPARAYLELMLRFQGMPFVDLAHLLKSDVKNDCITLHRKKTGYDLQVKIDERARELLARHAPDNPSSPYLLNILPDGLYGKKQYIAYQNSLRAFNNQLKLLAQCCGVTGKVTSYSMRYTWATQSKYCGIPLSIIAEGLGHSSVKTTEVYLKRYGESLLDKANKITLNYIFKNIIKQWDVVQQIY